MLCAVVGAWVLYTERPKPLKSWNKQAIAAEYDYVSPQGDKNNLAFYYTLQNNTDSDYRVDSYSPVEITGKLRQQKEFAAFSDKDVTTNYPVFVPARSRVRFVLNIEYPYPVREKSNPTDEEHTRYATDVAKYVTDKLSNLDGFVLFDTKNRYEIDFPTGWEKDAKEVPAQK